MTDQPISPPRIYCLHPLHPVTRQVNASAIYRIAAPAEALRRTGIATPIVSPEIPPMEKLKAIQPDSLVIQHLYTDEQIAFARGVKKLKVPMIYEIDDLFWELNESNPNRAMFPADIKDRIRKFVALCEHVVVSTAPLAARVIADLGVSKNQVVVAPNRLPQAFITAAKSVRAGGFAIRRDSRPRVGWAGGMSHADDLALLKHAIEATHTEIQWVFLGSAPEGVADKIEFHPAVQFSQYAEKLASLDLDLALAPLCDTPFNACKSNLRVLEYAACGYPVLASDVPSFQNIPGIMYVGENDPAEWLAVTRAVVKWQDTLDAKAQELHDWVKAEVLESKDSLAGWVAAWLPRQNSGTQRYFWPSSAPVTDIICTVGEPVPNSGYPHFPTIALARAKHPGCSILWSRLGAVVSADQIEIMSQLIGSNASAAAFTNDGDYPVPGQFQQISSRTAEDLTEAAFNEMDAEPIITPYAVGPAILLSSRALSLVGEPDVDRYAGDVETALIDWSMRVHETGAGSHIALPMIFAPARFAGSMLRDKKRITESVREIATWHPIFPQMQQAGAQMDMAPQRERLDRHYARLSYEAPQARSYAEWTSMHDALPVGREVDQTGPKISIIMPTYNTMPEHLKAAIDSVLAQTYQNWELVIVDDASTHTDHIPLLDGVTDERIVVSARNTNGHICEASNTALALATGEWAFFLDHDDTLAPFAVEQLARAAQIPDVEFIYADSDMISPEGELISPDFKPDFDYDLLLGQNYVCHPAMYKLETIRKINGLRKGFEGSQDYDLVLRYIEEACWDHKRNHVIRAKTHHIPLVLYHWRQAETSVASSIMNKPYALKAAHQAVLDHLTRVKYHAFLGQHPSVPMHNLARFLVVKDNTPSVAIIILTQQNGPMLDRCLTTLLQKTVYPDFKVIVRQVGDDPAIKKVGAKWVNADKRVSHIQGGGGGTGAFNFALLCNTMAKNYASKADVYVFLNDDTAITQPTWLHDMVATAIRPNVGAVGCKLVRPDGTVQHNGILMSESAPAGEACLHAHITLSANETGPYGRAALAHQASAVTAACMVVTRENFEMVGGFDAQNFPLDYNDVDFCLKLVEKGLDNVVLSHIVVIHEEGATKKMVGAGRRAEGVEAEGRLRDKHELFDEYLNPNLEFTPTPTALKTYPPRPWRPGHVGTRVLVIGAERPETLSIFAAGELPFVAEADGPLLRILEPQMPHGGTIDLRDQRTLNDLLISLNIHKVMLRRLNAGSAAAVLGALVEVAKLGIPVSYQPASFEAVCPRLTCINSGGACGHQWKNPTIDACQTCVDRDGSPYGTVSVLAWRAEWNRLANVLSEQQQADPAAEAAE